MKAKRVQLNEITKAYNEMHEALKFYRAGIDHFYKCINWGASPMDAEAIAFMNESNLKISEALHFASKAPEIIETA